MKSSVDIRHIILTGAEGKVGDAVSNSLCSRGLKVELSPLSADDVRFPEFVMDSGAGMVIPVFFPERLAASRDRLPETVVVPVESPDKLRLLDDKVQASALARSLGVRQPLIFGAPEEVTDFPCVFKRASGLGGSGVYFPKDRTALARLAASAGHGGSLIMEYVEGVDVSVDALRWDGYFRAEAYRVLLPRRKGTSFLRKSIQAPDLVEVARKMLDAVDYHGVCGFDFRVDTHGNPLFLEANPRFSGGVRSQILSGFDQPYLLWRLASGLQAGESVYRVGRYTVDAADAWKWMHGKKS